MDRSSLPRRGFAAVAATAAVLLAVGLASSAEEGADSPRIRPAPAFTAPQLLAPPRDGWLTNGGNLYNQRYSPLALIDRENVSGLKAKWRASLGGSGMGARHSGQAQPLVHEGTLYIVTGDNDVFAIDIDSGAVLWSYAARLDPADVVVCCGWVSRGVGMGEGKIFVGQLDAKLVALDQRTGEVVWSVQTEDPRVGYSLTSAPLYYDGLVITGFAGGDIGTRGRVSAYDAEDGSLRWTFYTVPAPGEPGHETWPQDNEVWQYGGAPVWHTPAVDPELGLIYFATGNAGPDLNGSVRPGDNLFTVSIVAIEAKTGKYRWHFQQVHHDIWDYDSPNPVVLFDAEIDGRKRRGLVQVSKTGWAYILDRETGAPLIGIEERPVPQEPRQHTAATQPYPIGDAIVPQEIDIAPEGHHLINQGRIFTPFWTDPVLYKPLAGVNWPPSSYDPETHLLYVCANDRIGSAQADDIATEAEPGFELPTFDGMWLGGAFGSASSAPGRGIFAALDVRTNRLVWRQQWADRCTSGSVATAGGLLFVGRNDGRLTALDKANGDLLWEFQTDAGINSTVSVFLHEGRQYVAVLAGGHIYSGSKRGDGVWLFSLDGTIGPLPPLPPESGALPGPGDGTPQEAAPPLAGPANLAAGRELYVTSCLPCHGSSGRGGHGGGASLEAAARQDIDAVVRIVSAGRNNMPAFRAALTPEQIRDVSAYVVEELF